MRYLCFAAAALAFASPASGQDGSVSAEVPEMPDGVVSEMLPAGEITMEVWRAGETGLPVVWVQDMHNYFTMQGEPASSEQFITSSSSQREFLARMGADYRVYAPMRRGYGNTDDDGAYDIASHGRALIAILESERIDRAVFMGRTSTQLDLLWLAENHPDRMAGIIFLEGTPQVLPDISDPDEFALASGFWRSALDISADVEKIDAITSRRLSSYVPDFLADPETHIDVPTLYLAGDPEWEGKWMWLEIFNNIGAQVTCPEATEDFPCNVFGDPERVARLQTSLTDHPMGRIATEARSMMELRFTDFRVDPFVMPTSEPSPSNMWDEYYQRIQPFLMSLTEEAE